MKLEMKQATLRLVIEKYAAAQAWLTDSSLFLPAMSSSGAAPIISRVVPFSASYTQSGDKGSDVYFKYLKLQSNTVTTKEYQEGVVGKKQITKTYKTIRGEKTNEAPTVRRKSYLTT